MKIDMDLILMALSGATMIVFALAIVGAATVGRALVGI